MAAGRSFNLLIAFCEKKVLQIVVFDLFLLFLCYVLLSLCVQLEKMLGSVSIYPLKILKVEIISLESDSIQVLVGQGCVNDPLAEGLLLLKGNPP